MGSAPVHPIDVDAEAILKWFCVAWHIVSYARGDTPRDVDGEPFGFMQLLDQLLDAGNDYANLRIAHNSNNSVMKVLNEWTLATGPNGYRSRCAAFAANIVRTVNPFGQFHMFPKPLDKAIRKQLIARWSVAKNELKKVPDLDIDSLLRAFAHERELAAKFATATTALDRMAAERKCMRLPKWDSFDRSNAPPLGPTNMKPPLTPLQISILAALQGRAYSGDALARKVGSDKRKLYRPGGIKELTEDGKVLNDRKVGYYRPDFPPT